MANTLNLFRQGAVGFIDWLDLLWQHKNTSRGFRIFQRDFVLGASGYSHDLVKLRGAGQFESAVAFDRPADNHSNLFGHRAECMSNNRCIANAVAAAIDNATGVVVWRSVLAALDSNESC
jgi:hypothetical protein